LVAELGKPLTVATGDLTHVWPEAEAIADADVTKIGLPRARQATLKSLASAVAEGDITLDPGADREHTRAKLLELPGIGPWTTDYIMMRALGDPDAFMPTDLGVVRALDRLGAREDPVSISDRWRPWRAYAQQHLWATPQ
jgi:AraC family transcriptional regulator of adaptative response / DNA-3-methyladenine glycosylase II